MQLPVSAAQEKMMLNAVSMSAKEDRSTLQISYLPVFLNCTQKTPGPKVHIVIGFFIAKNLSRIPELIVLTS